MANYPLPIASLLDPSCYTHPVKSVRVLETHISWVLLAGRYAYKIKKPVNLGFLDFSNLNQRRFYCEEEIRLNSRLAPKLYLDVVAIGGSPQSPVFGDTPAFEYAVRMRRFPNTRLMDRLATRSQLNQQHIDRLAGKLALFHQALSPADPTSAYGTLEAIADPARHNFQQLAALLKTHDMALVNAVQAASDQEFSANTSLFEQRRHDGFIRECHGDLHLGNIVLLKEDPTPFDGIEFEPKLRWIDVISDLAFLIMDLIHRERSDLAFRLLNAYLENSGDYLGLGTLRFYLAYRAMVRAKIAAIRASQSDSATANTECQSYISLATRCLQKKQPYLLITHGLPGCGKTTLSQAIVERLHAIRLRSDVERKRLFGLAAHEHSGGSIYGPEATQLTYSHLLTLARRLLAFGFPVVIDAAFLKSSERIAFLALAEEMRAPFVIISVKAETSLLRERILQRRQTGKDASEANLAVLETLQAASQDLQAEEIPFSVEFLNNASAAELVNDAPGWNKLAERLKTIDSQSA